MIALRPKRKDQMRAILCFRNYVLFLLPVITDVSYKCKLLFKFFFPLVSNFPTCKFTTYKLVSVNLSSKENELNFSPRENKTQTCISVGFIL